MPKKCLQKGRGTIEIAENLYEAQGDLIDGKRDSAAGSLDTAYIRTEQSPLSEEQKKKIIRRIDNIRDSIGEMDVDKLVKKIKDLRGDVTKLAFEDYYSCITE